MNNKCNNNISVKMTYIPRKMLVTETMSVVTAMIIRWVYVKSSKKKLFGSLNFVTHLNSSTYKYKNKWRLVWRPWRNRWQWWWKWWWAWGRWRWSALCATAVVANTTTERDSIHPPCLNQVRCPVSNVVGQGGKATTNAYGPHYVQV